MNLSWLGMLKNRPSGRVAGLNPISSYRCGLYATGRSGESFVFCIVRQKGTKEMGKLVNNIMCQGLDLILNTGRCFRPLSVTYDEVS